MKKVYISAGEPSGDLLGAELAREFKKIFGKKIELIGTTGDLMEAAGVRSIESIENLNVMGFAEVLKKLNKIRFTEQRMLEHILRNKPDLCILIDFPGLHFELARKLKKNNIKCVQYVAPKVWAWGKRRVHKLRADFDLVLGVLPFEKQFFLDHGVKYEYVGSPHLDRINGFKKSYIAKDSEFPIVALLPGSRNQEIQRLMPVLLDLKNLILKAKPNTKFLLPIANKSLLEKIRSHIDFNEMPKEDSLLSPKVPGIEKIYQSVDGGMQLVLGNPLAVLAGSDVAVCTSGTVTLECALLGVPQVVIYKTNAMSYAIAKRLVRLPYISLPNLIAEKQIITEYLQDFSIEDMGLQLLGLLNKDSSYHTMKKDYAMMEAKLLPNGPKNVIQTLLRNKLISQD